VTRTRTSATEAAPFEAGFTLVELLAVLAILAVAAAMFSFRSQAGFGTAKFRALMTGTASALRETRSRAITTASDQLFVIDAEGRTLTDKASGLQIDLPRDVTLSADVAESETDGKGRAGIRFYKDGSSTGGTLRFIWNSQTYAIDVNWLTGNVAINGL